MRVIAAIPARYAARRFPGKLLADLCGKPVIQHTYEKVHKSGLFSRVIIVTDSSEIESVALDFEGDVVRSQKDHQCGSDRIAEVVFDLDVDIVIKSEENRLRPSNSEVERLFGDNKLLKELTSWEPEYGGLNGFEKGLRITIDWFSDPTNFSRYNDNNSYQI